MAEPTVRSLPVGDISMRVFELGAGRPVVLLHGFPELAYSWRHQMPALAAAGHRAIAPDLRGFGGTDAPSAVSAYDVVSLAGDVVGLLDALGVSRAVVVGHDWGSELAWKLAVMHPERVEAVVGMSVPFVPRAPAPPIPILRDSLGEDFYMVWFQRPGVADEALARDVRRTLTTTRQWTAGWAEASEDEASRRPPFWTEEVLSVYVGEFSRTGFTGGLNWYRNIDRNWELIEPFAERRVEQPALFLTGERDPVRTFMPEAAMEGWVVDLRHLVILPGAGHWIQQERPEEVNAALLGFLGEVAPA